MIHACPKYKFDKKHVDMMEKIKKRKKIYQTLASYSHTNVASWNILREVDTLSPINK